MDTKESSSPQNQSPSSSIKPVTRRRFSKAQKRNMVEATLDGKASVSIVARQYDINANQLFRWRKQYHDGLLGETAQATLLPVKVSASSKPVTTMPSGSPAAVSGDDTIEIILSNHHRVIIGRHACQQSLLTILRVLS